MPANHLVTMVLLLASLSASAAPPHEHPPPVVLAPGYAPLEFRAPEPGTYQLPPLGHAADGEVLDSKGKIQRLHDLMGDKVTVMSFIFTRCNDVNGCPLATYVMQGVQDKILQQTGLKDRVRILSFSFDPDYDTPPVLASYAAHFRAPAFDWRFLTTSGNESLTPILDAYDQWVIKDYDSEGNFLGTMSHVLRVFLIDPQQRIRNIYSTSYLHADTVTSDVATLLKELDESQSPLP